MICRFEEPPYTQGYMFEGYILQYQDMTHNIRVITIQLPKDKPYGFEAGQYAVMHIKSEDPRPFSIASAPRANNTIDIHIRNSGQNISHKLCEELTQGEKIWVSEAQGTMALRHTDSGTPVVFLAGGTGITPFLAMIESLNDLVPIDLYWGMTTEHDFYIRPHRNGLTAHYCTEIYPIDAYLKDINDQAMHYISGPPAMVRDSVSKLLSIGIDRSRIIFDE